MGQNDEEFLAPNRPKKQGSTTLLRTVPATLSALHRPLDARTGH